MLFIDLKELEKRRAFAKDGFVESCIQSGTVKDGLLGIEPKRFAELVGQFNHDMNGFYRANAPAHTTDCGCGKAIA